MERTHAAVFLYRVMRGAVVDAMRAGGATRFPSLAADEAPCEAFDLLGCALQRCAELGLNHDAVVMRFAVRPSLLDRPDVVVRGEGRARHWSIPTSAWEACNAALVDGTLMAVHPHEMRAAGAPWAPDEVRIARGLENPGVLRCAVLVDAAPAEVAAALAPMARKVDRSPFGKTSALTSEDVLVLRLHGHAWSLLLSAASAPLHAIDSAGLSRQLHTRVIECSVDDHDGSATFLLLRSGANLGYQVWRESEGQQPYDELDRALRREDAWWPSWLAPQSFADPWQLVDWASGDEILLPDPPQIGGEPVPVEDAALLSW